ncbi:MAG TPA: hypothetical protein VK139_08140 [Microbacteriaceae bacterium]|nr:hypothetical protein [Microbacteriaceae bacterium]
MKRAGFAVFLACAIAAGLSECTPQGPVTPSVTFAGVNPEKSDYFIATGMVTGVSETGGKCVFTFWARTGVATRLSGEGRAEGDHTACGPVDEALGFLIGVHYEAELKYISPSGEEFMSERMPFELPRPAATTP